MMQKAGSVKPAWCVLPLSIWKTTVLGDNARCDSAVFHSSKQLRSLVTSLSLLPGHTHTHFNFPEGKTKT